MDMFNHPYWWAFKTFQAFYYFDELFNEGIYKHASKYP